MNQEKTVEHNAITIPTYGQVFQYVVSGFDLLFWQDAWADGSVKRSEDFSLEKINDQLHDWATQTTIPTRADFTDFLKKKCLDKCPPFTEELKTFLLVSWDMTLECHRNFVKVTPMLFYDEEEARRWQVAYICPSLMGLLFYFKHLFSYEFQGKEGRLNPILGKSVSELLKISWNTSEHKIKEKYPLTLLCVETYKCEQKDVDEKTVLNWRNGENVPSFASLGKAFKGSSLLQEIVINFALARFVESLAEFISGMISVNDLPDFKQAIVRESEFLQSFENSFLNSLKRGELVSLEDASQSLRTAYVMYHDLIAKSIQYPDSFKNESDTILFRNFYLRFLKSDVPQFLSSFFESKNAGRVS